MQICDSYKAPTFGYRVAIDLGASSPKCTAKCTVFSNQGKKLLEMPTQFLNDTVEGFNNNQDFVGKCANYFKNIISVITENVKNKQIKLSGKDKLLAGILLLVPGTTYINPENSKHNYIAFMPNVRDKQGNSLTKVSFDELEESLLNSSDENIALDKSKFKVLVSQDLSGTGLALASILKSRNELNEGDYVMGVVTGGGLGCVDIKVANNHVFITTSESSNYITGNSKLSSVKGNCDVCLRPAIKPFAKLGSVGASVKSCISNFANELNAPELTEILQQAGDARIVTDNIMQVSKNEQGLLDKIVNNKVFKQVGETDNKMIFSLNTEYFDEKLLKQACAGSVNSYAEALSLLCINKIDESINKVYLLGPLANALNRYIAENSSDFNNAKDLPDLIEKKIVEKICEDGINLKATQQLKELYNFEVICNPEINIPNNTYGGNSFFNKSFHFTNNRGNWMDIPCKDL